MASITSPETQTRLDALRQKASSGPLTMEEMREVVVHLRADRKSAASTKAKSTSKAKAIIPDADELLKELGLDL